MSKVYLVSSGSYSDYYVIGAFSTRELAEAYIAHRLGPDSTKSWSEVNREPEEIELDQPRESWPPGSWQVLIDSTGAVQRAVWTDRPPTTPPWHAPTWSDARETQRDGFFGHGETEEHARRSAEELRRRTLVQSA